MFNAAIIMIKIIMNLYYYYNITKMNKLLIIEFIYNVLNY